MVLSKRLLQGISTWLSKRKPMSSYPAHVRWESTQKVKVLPTYRNITNPRHSRKTLFIATNIFVKINILFEKNLTFLRRNEFRFWSISQPNVVRINDQKHVSGYRPLNQSHNGSLYGKEEDIVNRTNGKHCQISNERAEKFEIFLENQNGWTFHFKVKIHPKYFSDSFNAVVIAQECQPACSYQKYPGKRDEV